MALRGSFDLPALVTAMEALDADTWLVFYAEDAEWIEYKPAYPPRSPRVIRGKKDIGDFLERIARGGITLSVEDPVVGPDRAAYCLWVTLADGRRIVENVIVRHENGRITRQVDVEAWDPENE